jgi:hypothetical protein
VPCAQCEGIEIEFGRAQARRKLRSFRRRGPDRTTQLLIDALRAALDEAGARSVTLLDIGAGIGAIHHELLNGRVARAVHVDASTAHLAAAREETERRQHTDRVTFVHGDFVTLADTIPAAGVVTLDRVICCYDDMERLVRRSGEKAGQFYGAVYPRGKAWMRVGIAALNVVQRVKRSPFRVYLHAPDAIDAVLRATGLTRRVARHTLGWEVVVYERTTGASKR